MGVCGRGSAAPQNGNPAPNIPFTVPDTGAAMLLTCVSDTHVPTITLDRAPLGTLALLLAALLGLAVTRIRAWLLATRRPPTH